MPQLINPHPRCLCGATWKKKHKGGCNRASRATRTFTSTPRSSAADPQVPVTRQVVGKNPPPLATDQLVNRIAIVIDSSGSMGIHQKTVVDVFNSQIDRIKAKAHETKQKTYVSCNTFADYMTRKFTDVYSEGLDRFTSRDYNPRGNTALLDAIGETIKQLNSSLDANDKNTSFLLVVITDGEENHSSYYTQNDIMRAIQTCQASDRWTFAFAVPPSGERILQNWGIPQGNINVWHGTEKELKDIGYQMSVGTAGFYSARSAGQTSVKSYFTPDLSNLQQADVLKQLQDIRSQFKKLPVTKEQDISELVKSNLGSYTLGSAFYEITKPEDIQTYKDILIMHRKNGRVYGGSQARSVINMPVSTTVRITPGNHGDWRIFVQSTSMNRKLVRGTDVLYKI